MLARVFTLRFSSMLDGFDDTPLREFIKDKEVHTLRDHFFVRNDVPYLTLVVSYSQPPLLKPAAPVAENKPSGGRHDEGWRHLISEAEVPLFNALRDWRAERCKRDGLPPYVICTNRQLAAVIAARPQTLASLGRIEGFGEAKLKKYGQEILAILAKNPVAAAVATQAETAAEIADEDAAPLNESPDAKDETGG